jgi:holliday junction DNA helicase RuvA
MIRCITGTVTDTTLSAVVIDVQGVGYLVHITKLPTTSLGSTITLWTHLAVRETALDLYGFSTRDELELFELLLTLPKIGPKSAQQILTQADIELLKKAVLDDDPVYLAKMSGLGKKTAEKVVAGLKESFAKHGYTSIGTTQTPNASYISDAIDALIALGYPQSDARQAIQQLPPSITSANEAVREALKQLGSA